ncbi:MAG: T9SS type A sorting domain-containing protein [candidate division WOR-3 bacterium]
MNSDFPDEGSGIRAATGRFSLAGVITPGVYLVKIQTTRGKSTRKLVVR